jgi:hypothetical protein
MQKALAEALTGEGRVRVPDSLGRLFATYAYLGHLDVRPLDNPGKQAPHGRAPKESSSIEFRAEPHEGDGWRIEGKTEAVSEGVSTNHYAHQVKLEWTGFVQIRDGRIAKLLLAARGEEKLRYGSGNEMTGEEVASLPGGRPIKLECGVRYGLIGEPVTEGDAISESEAAGPPQALQAKLQELMRRIQALVSQGKVDEAEAAIDEVLKKLGSGEGGGMQSKMEQLQQEIRRWQREGRDPSPIGRIMQRFEPLIREGKVKEAEAPIDEALKRAREG